MTVVVSSILPAQDPALEKSSKWRNIPEWSEAVGAACAENGLDWTRAEQAYASEEAGEDYDYDDDGGDGDGGDFPGGFGAYSAN